MTDSETAEPKGTTTPAAAEAVSRASRTPAGGPVMTVDIGNSRVGGMLWPGDGRQPLAGDRGRADQAVATLIELWRAGTRDAPSPSTAPGLVVIASVRPEVEGRLRAAMVTALQPPARVISLKADVAFPLAERLGPESLARTGVDRLALAVGAADGWGPAVVTVCAGTAVTVDGVAAELGQPIYMGGAIMPGVKMQLAALAAGTAMLPHVELDAMPATSLGNSTAAAIRAGVSYGVVGAVERLIAEHRRHLGGETVPVVVGGGDGPWLGEALARGMPGVVIWGVAAVHWGMMAWLIRAGVVAADTVATPWRMRPRPGRPSLVE